MSYTRSPPFFFSKSAPVVCMILASASLIGGQNTSIGEVDSRIRTAVSQHLRLHQDTWHRSTTCSVSQKLGLSDMHLCLYECHAFLNRSRQRDLQNDALLLPCFITVNIGSLSGMLQFQSPSLQSHCILNYKLGESQFQICHIHRPN